MQLNQGQQGVLLSALKFMTHPDERHMVIKGKAGTGKSFLTKELHKAALQKAKVIAMLLKNNNAEFPIYLTATTNKAAKVLADFVGVETSTIHSLLGLRVRSDWQDGTTKLSRNKDSQVIEDALIIIDEAFYIDPMLLKYIEEGTKNCKIIFIGDPYQCAPIRQTCSPIENLQCRTEELTQVMRNGGILSELGDHWRTVVISGVFKPFTPVLHSLDPDIIVQTNGAQFAELINKHFYDKTKDETENKIVSWTNKRSIEYSNHVRQLRGLPDEFTEGEYVQIFNSLPKQGFSTDTVIRIKKFIDSRIISKIPGKQAELYSGNALFIPDSNQQMQQRLKELAANKEWREYFSIQESIPDLRAVHGCTIHKAQGSTYKNTFIDLADIGACNIASDVARMMHVAVTRPSEKVIFRGSLPAKYGG